MKTKQISVNGRFGGLYLFFAVFIALSFITRTILLAKSLPVLDLTPWLLVKIYGVGLFFDIVAAAYFSIPLVLYLTVIPDKIYQGRFHKPVIYLFSFVILYLLVFNSFAEYFFFDEFGVRFNFIAVDYLIYTHEVVKNIMESYPMPAILTAIAVISLIILISFRKLIDSSIAVRSSLKQRIKIGFVFIFIPILSFVFVDLDWAKISANNYANELSANGIYSLFAAFRNNKINYETFYATRDDRAVFQKLRFLLSERNNSFADDNIFDITREIKNTGEEKRLNVVVIVEESFSAEFLGVFGNRNNLTPNLDRLAKESILFTNMHATGTRTDRGLEAVTLSVPPTPGRSLVKRPNNENMFSWGFMMKSKGYDTKFFYGGYGYFDNMNYFFSHNGFDNIVDRTDFARNEVVFENAWGVSDEDLFNKSIKEFNKSYGNNKPFFALIMTTSNHRPYTYPDGRIDIPSHSGREGAVKYADYAIGKLIRDAQKEPWFKDTVFVIVADHCAGSAGKTSLPVKRYEIPLLIYSPSHFSPQRIDKLASQIDIAPTVLGLLNFSYRTKFFGKDIFKMQPEQERALIGTYQKLGYVKNDRLVVLDIKKEAAVYQFNRDTGEARKLPPDPNLLNEAVSYYQGANYLFEHNLNKF
ncbi:MAG: LTA synthase family protein [Nitrospirae bacterium]|nr:LTA synthase family protein [Nitrospirota bacterium]MDA8215580.1 LTA synthase family protein [Nitrospiraceae bacterium]MDA8338425.1 LTA synthase family protein [Nitrospiraceae bacterium]